MLLVVAGWLIKATVRLAPTEGTSVYPGSLEIFANKKLIEKTDAQNLSASDQFDVLNGFYAENAAFFDNIKASKSSACNLRSVRQSIGIMQCIRNRRKEYVNQMK